MMFPICGNMTFTGKPKDTPVGIYPSQVAKLDAGTTPWGREAIQRNYIKEFIKDIAEDDDIIILRDADEIVRHEAPLQYKEGICCLQMDEMHFYLNTRSGVQTWRHPKIMRWIDLKDKQPNDVRAMGGEVIENAGFHFSWTGDVNSQMEKFQSFSHQEPEIQKMAHPGIIQARKDNLYHLFTGKELEVVPLGELPAIISQPQFEDMLYGNS